MHIHNQSIFTHCIPFSLFTLYQADSDWITKNILNTTFILQHRTWMRSLSLLGLPSLFTHIWNAFFCTLIPTGWDSNICVLQNIAYLPTGNQHQKNTHFLSLILFWIPFFSFIVFFFIFVVVSPHTNQRWFVACGGCFILPLCIISSNIVVYDHDHNFQLSEIFYSMIWFSLSVISFAIQNFKQVVLSLSVSVIKII